MTKKNIVVPCVALMIICFSAVVTQNMKQPKTIAASQIDPSIAEIVWSH